MHKIMKHWVVNCTDVCSSLVAHLATVAAIRVRFPASCQHIVHKVKWSMGTGAQKEFVSKEEKIVEGFVSLFQG